MFPFWYPRVGFVPSSSGLKLRFNPVNNSYFKFNAKYLEFCWTLAPSIPIVVVTVPAIFWLWAIEGVYAAQVKMVCGNQWYWSY